MRPSVTAQLATWFAGMLLVCAVLAPGSARAAGGPLIWDDDGDGIDDRMETVHLLGLTFSFERGDTLARQRFEVTRANGDLLYGVYVLYKAAPTDTDLAALTVLGMPVLHRFTGVHAVRSVATYAQVLAAKASPAVERIEVVPLLYPQTREDAASIGAVDPSNAVFPTWAGAGGGDGDGVVVAILDTGINDAPDGAYPGHESLAGRRLGGAQFTHGDSTLDTPRGGSTDPDDHGGLATHAHGTHVAGIVLGTGGTSGYARGIAPAARFVDVKVIGDTGLGTGVAEALDWCIANRARDWGAGAAWQGIDVINLSLSSLDASDGRDVPALLAARAVELGIVVVASVGNDGLDAHVPSPAAGAGVLAVGAYDAQRSGRAEDDVFAAFGDRGPRADDGDGDPAGELKPDVVAPGVAVLSANGDLSTDGTRYVRMSGTSQAAAVVSGAVAALRAEFPSLTPAAIAAVLRTTARRTLGGVPAAPPGADPRWHAAIGYGALDLFAARLELLAPEHTQFRRLTIDADSTHVRAGLWTMRERGAAFVVLERAPDAGGVPGAFVAVDSVAAAGDSSLAASDLHVYTLTHEVPPEERGVAFWYRAAVTEDGVRRVTDARRDASPVGRSAATVLARIVHDAYDHDVDAAVKVGLHAWPLPGTSGAVASDWVDGLSETGTVAWDFALEIPAGVADELLPPTAAMPWRLELTDGGYLNRGGRIAQMSIVWHGPDGDVTFNGGPVPMPTFEGQAVAVFAPQHTAGVGGPAAPAAFRVAPSPVFAGGTVTVSAAGAAPARGAVYDAQGRHVAALDFTPASGGWTARWNTGTRGAGIYFVRAGGAAARVVVLRP